MQWIYTRCTCIYTPLEMWLKGWTYNIMCLFISVEIMKISAVHLKFKIISTIILFIIAVAFFHVWCKYNSYNAYDSRYGPGQEQQPLPPTSNDVIVRSVYFDDRARNGHDKIGVFLVAMRESIFDSKSLIGCGVGKKVSSNFRIVSLEENRLMHKWLYVHKGQPHFPYEEYILECYDLPMTNNSNAYVLFKNITDSPIYMAVSEFPLMFPSPRVQPTGKYDFSVVTCTEAHNKKVAWLREFVRYQKTIGIDRVHINILDTFSKDGGLAALLKDPQVAKGVSEGYVTMTVWKDRIESSDEIFSFSAILRKLDCVYRFRGTYDYAFLLDSDDFFTPLVSGKTYLKDYIQDWCRGDRSIGSCIFKWFYYYPEACGMRNETANDGNITKLLKSYTWFDNHHYKSAHLISAVFDTGFHHAVCKNCLLPGYRVIHVPPHIAYVAHLRKKAKPPHGC